MAKLSSMQLHLNRAAANIALLDQWPDLKAQNPHWYVTVAFYAALHAVRALANFHGHVFDNHQMVKEAECSPALWDDLKNILPTYNTVKTMSENGRYKPWIAITLATCDYTKTGAVKILADVNNIISPPPTVPTPSPQTA